MPLNLLYNKIVKGKNSAANFSWVLVRFFELELSRYFCMCVYMHTQTHIDENMPSLPTQMLTLSSRHLDAVEPLNHGRTPLHTHV